MGRARPLAELRLAGILGRAALIAVALALATGIAPARADEVEQAPKPAPEGGQYFKLDPFVVPIVGREAVVRHLTVVATLELADEGKRTRIRERLPLMRHALNTALLQIVGVERKDGSLPPIALIKRRMLDVARDVTGPEVVRDVLMESVYERRLR